MDPVFKIILGVVLIVLGIITVAYGCTNLGWPSGVFVPMLGTIIIYLGLKGIVEGIADD